MLIRIIFTYIMYSTVNYMTIIRGNHKSLKGGAFLVLFQILRMPLAMLYEPLPGSVS